MVAIVDRPAQKNKPLSFDKETLADLQKHHSASCSKYEHLTKKKLQKSATVIVAGIGSSLRVRGDALEVTSGRTYYEQASTTQKLYRGVHKVSRIIILSENGFTTLDALKWCHEQNIAIVMLDYQGNLVQSLSPEYSDARLRRAQYAASPGPISCELVKRKVAGQLEALKKHPELPGQAEAIQPLADALKWFDLPTLPDRYYDVNWLRTLEGRCADVYFRAWRGLPVKWDKAVRKTVPPHWLLVTDRGSPLSHGHGARWAVCPAMAILNYAYAILEAQVRQALNAVGFDVACGYLHADQLYKDALVFDVMELHRGGIDHLVLKLLASTTFNKGDVMSRPSGEVRFNPQLARYISASCQLPQEDVNSSAKWLQSVVVAG